MCASDDRSLFEIDKRRTKILDNFHLHCVDVYGLLDYSVLNTRLCINGQQKAVYKVE